METIQTISDGKFDVAYLRRCAYKAYMEGDKDKMRKFIKQAILLDDTVIIYKLVRTGDEPSRV